jgi:hypothetical protein
VNAYAETSYYEEELTRLTILAEQKSLHKDYVRLQLTWNRDVLRYFGRYLPQQGSDCSMISLGPFLGILETVLSEHFQTVLLVDMNNEIVFPTNNMPFLAMNLDSCHWSLPEVTYDVCLMVELIEHLMWSPVPLLKWVATHSRLAVITTPDDAEWPPLPPEPYMRYLHFSTIPPPFPGCTGNPNAMNHCKQYECAEFIELLCRVGLRVLEFQRIGLGHHQMLAICEPR